METEVWKINYISYEGEQKWFTAEVPVGIDEWQLEEKFDDVFTGGVGDDPAVFLYGEWFDGKKDGCERDWTDITVYNW